MQIAEIKDRPVIGIREGEKLGTVQDALLDASLLQVAALVVGGGGLFGGPKQAVEYSAVHGIGPDAVMVSGADAVQEVNDTGPLSALPRASGMDQEVMSESGVRIGHLRSVHFDPQSGMVTSLTLEPEKHGALATRGAFDISRSEVISVTDKLLVVRHSVLEQAGEPPVAERTSVDATPLSTQQSAAANGGDTSPARAPSA